jgi:membrane protease YdiL (CAAX protease family)
VAVCVFVYGLQCASAQALPGDAGDELSPTTLNQDAQGEEALRRRILELKQADDCQAIRSALASAYGSVQFESVPVEILVEAALCLAETENKLDVSLWLAKTAESRNDEAACRARLMAAALAGEVGDNGRAEQLYEEAARSCEGHPWIARLAKDALRTNAVVETLRTPVSRVLMRVLPPLEQRPYLLAGLEVSIVGSVPVQLSLLGGALTLWLRRRSFRGGWGSRSPGTGIPYLRVILWIGLYWLLSQAVTLVYIASWEEPGQGVSLPRGWEANLQVVSCVIGSIVLASAIAAEGQVSRLLSPPETGWRRCSLWAGGGIVLTALVVLVVIGGPADESSSALGVTSRVQPYESTSGVFVLSLLACGVLPVAVLEEWFFRGWVQKRLLEELPRAFAVTISAALFSAAHFPTTIQRGAILFVVGVIAGTLALAARSIWAPVLYHAGWNLLAVSITLLTALQRMGNAAR